ncbi:MAG: hypothetical protein NT169_26375 [Chloroflexi bacterium]|nr:hypothetical protein [Chloroflexota bacterium]
MTPNDPSQLQQMAADAAQWRELITLLSRKAYKTTMTPAEIVAQLPDLREVYRSLHFADSSPARSAENGRFR